VPELETAPAQATVPITTVDRPAQASPSPNTEHSRFQEFFAAFVTIFIAEIGDKTQLATLLMSAESRSPWVVFAGTAMALLATSLVGVLIGRWLARRISGETLKTLTGAGMLVMAVLLLWDVVQLG
jgi:putative Ca2+/H+ antiporter (TMEM165/GDT1 family)